MIDLRLSTYTGEVAHPPSFRPSAILSESWLAIASLIDALLAKCGCFRNTRLRKLMQSTSDLNTVKYAVMTTDAPS